MRAYSHLASAAQIVDEYRGDEPFASFIKKYFSAHKKFGSKDRKQVAHLCYCYFRLGKSVPANGSRTEIEKRILLGLFLCSGQSNEILEALKPEWNRKTGLSLKEKLLVVDQQIFLEDVFPWGRELSGGLDHLKFCESFFLQPDLFLRLRHGHEKLVTEKLSNAKIDFLQLGPSCLALPNSSKIDNLVELDKEAVVQDYNSQQIGRYFELPIASRSLPGSPGPMAAWDCCAASGGKSLLLYDLHPNIDLTVSDVRESILANLKKRFLRAGIIHYRSFVVDLAGNRNPPAGKYDLIICDAPCTGSGTWSRTPEQLYFFDEKKIESYSLLQKKITSKVIPHVKPGGFFLYITCSVFKRENEEVVRFIRERGDLMLVEMSLLKGYDKKSDTMFVALFRSPL